MISVPPLPEVKKVSYITPTSYETFRTCYLKGVLEWNGDYEKFIFLHPKTILGIVAHEVISDLFNKRLDSILENDFNSSTKLIKDLFKNKCQSYYNNHIESPFLLKPNSVEDWPGYNLRLSRLIYLIHNINKNRKNIQRTLPRGTQSVEVIYEVYDGKIKGKPDKVKKVNDHEVILEDYKTGQIFDGDFLKPRIRRQMLIYSFICQEVFNITKVRFVVIPLSGPPYKEDVDLLEVKSVVNDALNTLDHVNQQIETVNLGLKTLSEMAQPSTNACKYCSFKFLCSKFLENDDLRLSSESFNVQGKVIRYTQYGKFNNIYLECNLSKIVIIKNINEKPHSLLGENIRLVDLQLEGEDDFHFIATPTYRTMGFKL